MNCDGVSVAVEWGGTSGGGTSDAAGAGDSLSRFGMVYLGETIAILINTSCSLVIRLIKILCNSLSAASCSSFL